MFVSGFGTQDASDNRKLIGYRTPRKVYATYRKVGDTCPSTCSLLPNKADQKGGCYAANGNVGIHQLRAGSMTFNAYRWALTLPIDSLIRWNVSGDVVGTDGALYRASILKSHLARPDLGGWLYTHSWSDPAVFAWSRLLTSNINVVASVDSIEDGVKARAMGWRAIAMVAPGTPEGHWDSQTARSARTAHTEFSKHAGLRLVTCPAQRTDRAPVGCADCLVCQDDAVVLFASHGVTRNQAKAALNRYRLKVLDATTAA